MGTTSIIQLSPSEVPGDMQCIKPDGAGSADKIASGLLENFLALSAMLFETLSSTYRFSRVGHLEIGGRKSFWQKKRAFNIRLLT